MGCNGDGEGWGCGFVEGFGCGCDLGLVVEKVIENAWEKHWGFH